MASPKSSKTRRKGPDGELTPVLIIPGFMSSVLTVQSSSLSPAWKDQRIWLNITTLGFNSIKRGGKLQRNEEVRSQRILNSEESGKAVSLDPTLEQMHADYLKQVECKNKWVQHMQLADDLISERKGVVVRPLQGTEAVDYLSEGALVESASYVFGPVLKLLRSVGYTDGKNLDAASYDWRIPPSVLESRDQYFTKTIEKIEQLYHFNQNAPVVILSHSMGCRVSHYLFNFVIQKKGEENGMKWLAKYIKFWVPVGAPHIGTPTSIRCMMVGDKMGLDAFLSDFEGLCLARSFGSPPWLFPLEKICETQVQQPVHKATMPTSFVRQESSLTVIVPPQRLNIATFLKDMKNAYPTKIRLAIRIGKETIRTNHFVITEEEPFIDFNNETWIIPCPSDCEKTAKLYSSLQLCIEKPGASLPKKRERGVCEFVVLWPLRFVLCVLKWLLCCPCALLSNFCGCLSYGAEKGINVGASALGASVVIGDSDIINVGDTLLAKNSKQSDTEEGTDRSLSIGATLKPVEQDGSLCEEICYLLFWQHRQSEKLSIVLKWETMNMNSWEEPTPLWQKSRQYISTDTHELITNEGMGRVIRLLQNTYESDPIEPLSKSSWQAPPIKQVHAIYGINYPTEVAAVYKRNPVKHIPNASNTKSQRSELEPTFVLDKDAILDKPTAKTHTFKQGLIYETSKSPQTVRADDGTTTTEFKSGDGSVPYWSLSHCRLWQGRGAAECDVNVYEIDSVEHRAILNDSRFHNILLDLLGFK